MLTDSTCAIAITADLSFRKALAAEIERENTKTFVESKTRNSRCSNFAIGGFANTRKVPMLLGDEGDGNAERGR